MIPGDPPLYVSAVGEGPGLLLGHGFGGSARNFRPQQRALADLRRVVAWDARGHARSGAPRDPAAYHAPALVADLLRVQDACAEAPCAVGGLSLGAAVALRAALDHPERVDALVLASYPSPRGFGAVGPGFADAIEAEGLEAAGERFVWGERSGLDPRGAALVRQGFLEHAPHALAALLREALPELADLDALAPRLALLRVPALLLAGARDAGSLEASQRLAERLPTAELVVIPDAGHVVNLERPAPFDAALRRFLSR